MTLPLSPWTPNGWLAKASFWIHAQLDKRQLKLSGHIEQLHIRPWSMVLTVPTDGGLLYFKATAPYLGYETAITDFLSSIQPGVIPDLLATDYIHGWMLMRESGIPLRAFIKAEKSVERWREIMPLYVGLQKEVEPGINTMLALGVPDRRLDVLPEKFERLVADEASMLVDQPESITSGEYRRLKDSVGKFEKMCRTLDSLGIPETLHHDDFHDGNVFIQDKRVIFTDWGECAITHPFFSMVVMLRGAENSLDLQPDALELALMRDWYLGQWTDYAPMKDLHDTLQIAERIGLVNRALTWHWIISHLSEEVKPEYAMAVPAYLQEFINQ